MPSLKERAEPAECTAGARLGLRGPVSHAGFQHPRPLLSQQATCHRSLQKYLPVFPVRLWG